MKFPKKDNPVAPTEEPGNRPLVKEEQVHVNLRSHSGSSEKNLLMPHERDEATSHTAPNPDPIMLQAKRDLDSGQVDTDMRAIPGLDKEKRSEMVPGPGGKSVSENFKEKS